MMAEPSPDTIEKRGSLTSVRGFPLHDDFAADEDQAVRGTIVGNVKGIVRRRRQPGDNWVTTFEIEVLEVQLDPL